jgi:hypothetical protein
MTTKNGQTSTAKDAKQLEKDVDTINSPISSDEQVQRAADDADSISHRAVVSHTQEALAKKLEKDGYPEAANVVRNYGPDGPSEDLVDAQLMAALDQLFSGQDIGDDFWDDEGDFDLDDE